jgi:hypothetical protein
LADGDGAADAAGLVRAVVGRLPRESRLRQLALECVEEGLAEGYPPCCVLFFSLFWWPLVVGPDGDTGVVNAYHRISAEHGYRQCPACLLRSLAGKAPGVPQDGRSGPGAGRESIAWTEGLEL